MARRSDGHWPFPPVSFEVDPASTALLIVDMQYYCAHPDYALTKAIEAAEPGAADYFSNQVRDVVTPNLQRLLAFFRERRLNVIYVAFGSAFEDGRDLSPLSRARSVQRQQHAGCAIPIYQGGFEYGILPEVRPQPGELVISKRTAGAFASTTLDQLLRNVGVESLVVCGVVTDGCVESTARGASDCGYKTILASDGCATYEVAAHEASLRAFSRYFGQVQTTEEIISRLAR